MRTNGKRLVFASALALLLSAEAEIVGPEMWYAWSGGNVGKAGIARDLEEIAAVHVLESPALRITFGDERDGFGIRSVENRLGTDVRFVDGHLFWRIRLMRKADGTNEFFTLTSRMKAKERRAEIGNAQARFVWSGMDLPADEAGTVDVAASVRMVGDGSEWNLAVRNRSNVWGAHTTEYPVLENVMAPKTGDVLLPWKNLGGRLFKAFDADRLPPPHREYNVPGVFMPVCAFMRDGAGLYLAAHDGEQRIKRLCIRPKCEATFATILENAGVPQRAATGPKYPVVLTAFRGDWWRAAHIYREWATRQKWCAKGKIAERTDYPRNVLETDLWLNFRVKTTNTIAQAMRLWSDLRLAVGAAGWYRMQPGNRMNPEFFPANSEDVASIRWCVENGVHVMPYVNGRIWDTASVGFAYARQGATIDEDGNPYEERYQNATFAVMCPYDGRWQSVMHRLGLRCLDELKCDMLYYDQVSCSRPRPCYNPAHGHPLGGGSWWAEGYRRMFGPIREEFAKRGAAITSEQLGEAWIDLIDAYLNASDLDARDVPLFPAVYQGYTMHFGRAVGVDKPSETREWRFLQDAKTVLWGEAPGWIGPHIVRFPKYRDEAENLRRVAKFRRVHAEHLIYGSLEGEARLEKPDPWVYGTFWKDAQGRRPAAAFVNASETEKTAVFSSEDGRMRQVTLPPMSLIMQNLPPSDKNTAALPVDGHRKSARPARELHHRVRHERD